MQSPNSELPMGYTAVPMAWTGPIEKGGQNYIFAGTHQQVTEQIKKANPDFSWSDLRDNATEASVRGLQIESRATDSKVRGYLQRPHSPIPHSPKLLHPRAAR